MEDIRCSPDFIRYWRCHVNRFCALFIVILVLTGTTGCAIINKYPLTQAFSSPRNAYDSLARATDVKGKAHVVAKLPTMQPGTIHVESNGAVTIITIVPPVDPQELARVKAQHPNHKVKVAVPDDGKGGRS